MRKIKSSVTSAQIQALIDEKGLLQVLVTPNASRNEIATQSEGELNVLLIRTTATPEDGKANAEIIVMLSKALGMAKSNLTIMRGTTSRRKVVKVGSP